MKPTTSTFYVPEDRPIVMIANGTGIAPFRSIAQYVASLPQGKRPYMRLYYGIQSDEVDFYFKEEWEALEREKLVELRVAQSRRDPQKKIYVQHLL